MCTVQYHFEWTYMMKGLWRTTFCTNFYILHQTNIQFTTFFCYNTLKTLFHFWFWWYFSFIEVMLLKTLDSAWTEQAHISSNLSFIELDFEHMMSSRKMNFLGLDTSLPICGTKISSIWSFIEFQFLKNTNHRTWNSSDLKFEL